MSRERSILYKIRRITRMVENLREGDDIQVIMVELEKLMARMKALREETDIE